MFRRVPLRSRVTLGFTLVTAVLLAATAVLVYTSMASVLLDDVDTGLRSRAATIEAALPGRLDLGRRAPGLVESHEAFAQVLDIDGSVLDSSIGARSIVPVSTLTATVPGSVRYVERSVPGVANEARMLVTGVRRHGQLYVLVVGASMSDRADALHFLVVFFAIAGPVIVLIASAAGWLIAGRALRTVERLRREAATITATSVEQRLTVPPADDELRALALTLNDMLRRLDDAQRAEHDFLARASHELRTPLAALRAELDLATRRPRDRAEIEAALVSASAETDRLARLAADMLLLARSHGGALALRPEPTAIDELLNESAALFRARADDAGIAIAVDAPRVVVFCDRDRVRQAVDNLVDNALRFAQHRITLRASVEPETAHAHIRVEDDGPGLDGATDGLGLRIVRAIVAAHGGTTDTHTANTGACVELVLPIGDRAAPH